MSDGYSYIDSHSIYIDAKTGVLINIPGLTIEEYIKIDSINMREISEKLAVILDNTNFLHTFREGNGRTQREFLILDYF